MLTMEDKGLCGLTSIMTHSGTGVAVPQEAEWLDKALGYRKKNVCVIG